jgi:hypothetical protein
MTSLFILIFSSWLGLFNNAGHPSHYTVTNIDYVIGSKSLAIAIKVNTEDLKFVLSHNYQKSLHLENKADQKIIDSLLSYYISTAITFKINKKHSIPINFQLKEIVDTDTWIYCTASKIIKIKELEITNSLFFDAIMDNTNLVIFSIGGKEEGFKTTFYERVVTVQLKKLQ